MSKINKKHTLSIKAILYVENNVISFEDANTGEVIPVASLAQEFDARECTLSIAYAEEYGQEE
jgi:hypothetical protein